MKACAFIAFLALPIDIINVHALSIDLATSADMYLKPNTSPVLQCSSVFDVITIHLDQSDEGNAHTIENLF